MGSSSKRRQTMAKMTRERTLQEKRAQKKQKKDEKKQAAAAAKAADGTLPVHTVEDEQAAADRQAFGSNAISADSHTRS